MLFQTSIGIDVRHDKFNVVALKTRLTRMLPAAHTTYAFDADLAPEDRVRIIADVVGQFIRQHRIMAADLFVAIPRELILLREIRLPLSVKENLRTTLTYEMGKYIPLPVEEIYFDCQITEEDREDNQMRLLLFAVRRRDIDVYLNLATHLGQKLSGIEIPATALGAFLVLHPPVNGDPAPLGIVRIDGRGGELCVYRDGLLTASQWVDLPADPEAAPAQLHAAVRAMHERCGGAVRWRHSAGPGGNGLPASFDTADDPPVDRLPVASAGLPDADWAPAYGLAARGLRSFAAVVNLLPHNLRKKPNRRAYYTLLGLAAVAILLAAAWGASHLLQHRMAMSRIQAELGHLRPQAAEAESLREANSLLETRITHLEALRRSRVSALLVLEDLSARIPRTAWVEHLAFQSDGVRITGFADSASELVTLLEASPLFTDVVFLSAITRTREGKERFQIGMGFEISDGRR